MLYVTNQHVFFERAQKNVTTKWSAVAEVRLFEGGVILEKNSGRSPHLLMDNDDIAAAASQLTAPNS